MVVGRRKAVAAGVASGFLMYWSKQTADGSGQTPASILLLRVLVYPIQHRLVPELGIRGLGDKVPLVREIEHL